MEYSETKSRLKYARSKVREPLTSSIDQVVVTNTKTKSNEDFLILDNKKPNRILFVSSAKNERLFVSFWTELVPKIGRLIFI